MNTHSHRHSVVTAGCIALLLALGFTAWTRSAFALECVGKPYGYPGCPTRTPAMASSSSGPSQCGNAIVDNEEQCDQGRFNGKAECSTNCKLLYCGDGILSRDAGEECEPETQEVYVQDKNGNLTTETQFTGTQCGWYCQAPSCTADGTCSGGCTLRYIDECPLSEDGEDASADASESSAPAASSAAASCGNGTVDTGEECDDANRDNADSCTNACTLSRCGDAIVQGKEECDAGSGNSNTAPNGCRSSCLLARCGDSVTDTGEQCDAGAGNSNTGPNACRINCTLPSCGDGVRDTSEDCDDGNLSDMDACSSTCRVPRCGDGIVQSGEQCDAGSRNSDSESNACRSSCILPRCGDRVIDAGEQCDGQVSCTALCKFETITLRSAATSSAPTIAVAATTSPRTTDNGGLLLALLGAFGLLFTIPLILFHRKFLSLLGIKKTGQLEDVPLDQIEMPWHKW